MLFSLPLIVLFLSACASQDGELSEEQKKSLIYYTHGTEALVDKDYTKALKLLSEAHKLDLKNSKVKNNLGMAYYFKGDEKKAVELLQNALAVDPKNMDARNNLASIYLENKDYDKALREYKIVEEDLSYENQYRTLYNIALAHKGKGQRKEALSYLRKSVKENENYCPASLGLALYSYRDKDYKQALDLFREASMGLCVQTPEPHYYGAKTLMHLGEYDKAFMKFTKVQEDFSDTKYFAMADLELKKIRALDKDIEDISRARQEIINARDDKGFEGARF